MSKKAKSPGVKSLTKAQLVDELAKKTEQSKATINTFFEALAEVIDKEINAGRPVTVYGMLKVKMVRKPRQEQREGHNPKTGAKIIIKAKPARNVVKVQALKRLKEMVAK
jgi:nucleoid DNA-binding protein